MDVNEAHRIANDFHSYLANGDRSLIKKHSKEKLRAALNILPHSDNRHQWYKEMERRVSEIEQEEKAQLTKKEKNKSKWIDRTVTFLLGILAGIILMYLKRYLKMN